MITLLLEGALDDEATRISAKEGDHRKDQWVAAVEFLRGVPAAKQLLVWLSRNVPLDEPLEDVVPLLIDWARMRDEKKLLPGEVDLSRLDRSGLERINKRANIGRDMTLRMPEAPIRTVHGGGKTWDIYLPMNIGESCAVARMASPGNDSYEIPWCTARDKNNMFYGYAANDVLLYYVVNRGYPEEKYSVGFHEGQFIDSSDGGATVDWQNKAFSLREAFGSAWENVMYEITKHVDMASSKGLHPAAMRVLEAASDPTAWRELIKKTSDDPDHEIGLYRTLVLPSYSVGQHLGNKLRNGLVPMHPHVALSFLLAAARAGEENYGILNHFRQPIEQVIEDYMEYLTNSPEGVKFEAEIRKILKDSDGGSGGYHTPASIIELRINAYRELSSGKSKAIDTIRSVKNWKAVEEWIIENAAVLPTTKAGAKAKFVKTIAEQMPNDVLAVMMDPIEAFDGLEDRLRNANFRNAGGLLSRWPNELWAELLLVRIMASRRPKEKLAAMLVDLLKPYGDYRLPLRYMHRVAKELPSKKWEHWNEIMQLTMQMWNQ